MRNSLDRISSAPGDAGSPDAARVCEAAPPSPLAVLVAEQDDASREDMVSALDAAGYMTWQVPDGTSALRWLREAPSPIILVAEEDLPEFGGFQLARLLALTDAGAARFGTIVLTASLGEAIRRPGYGKLDVALREVLVKPFHVKELLLAVGFAADRLAKENSQNTQTAPDGRIV